MTRRAPQPRPRARRPNPAPGRLQRPARTPPEVRAALDAALLGLAWIAHAWAARALDANRLEAHVAVKAFRSFLRPDLYPPGDLYRALFDGKRLAAFHEGLARNPDLPVFALHARVATELEAAANDAAREGYASPVERTGAFVRAEELRWFARYLRTGVVPPWADAHASPVPWFTDVGLAPPRGR